MAEFPEWVVKILKKVGWRIEGNTLVRTNLAHMKDFVVNVAEARRVKALGGSEGYYIAGWTKDEGHFVILTFRDEKGGEYNSYIIPRGMFSRGSADVNALRKLAEVFMIRIPGKWVEFRRGVEVFYGKIWFALSSDSAVDVGIVREDGQIFYYTIRDDGIEITADNTVVEPDVVVGLVEKYLGPNASPFIY